MLQTLTYIINVAPEGVPQVVRLSQNENGRTLAFTLTGAGTVNIPSGSTVTISGTKPDGVVYSQTGTLSGTTASFPETTQMTAVSGIWPAKIKVTYGGETIATCKVVMAIDPDPVAPGSVPSSSQLNGLVAEAQQYATYAKYEAFGSPLVAATAAAMTDKTRVYVYTGSETGKTAGHWYYWNGSAWTDGGAYNSQGINTDTTLTLSGMAADAKATGDQFTLVKEDLNYNKTATPGYLLRATTTGHGSEWSPVGLPSDAQTAEAVTAWLNAHPEATTTVQDGSLTEAKFSDALKVKAIKEYITPDMFEGYNTDGEKLQAAVDYSIAHGFPSIFLEREYDLTGRTIYINKGTRVTDEVSSYSRNKLVFFGVGVAKLKKTDTGYMFSATALSGDISFDSIKFIGSASGDTPDTCTDMTVFDCEKLIRLTVINCNFTWCGHVYYQDNIPAKTAQSIVSVGNLYAKNKIVAEFTNLFDGRFIADTIEDGVQFLKSDFVNGSALRALTIIGCCIEGMSGTAVESKNTVYGANVNSNYFEANSNHISFEWNFSGSICGNAFFGRGNLSQDIYVACIRIALAVAIYNITSNYCIDTNPKTTLIEFNTNSPYYNTRLKVYGANDVAPGAVLTNVPENVIGARVISQVLSSFDPDTVTEDLTSAVQDTYSQITGGSIVYTKKNGICIVDFINVVVSGAINSGSHTDSASLLKPTDGATHAGVLGNNTSGQCGTCYINDQGSFGIRIPNAGTYNGQIVFR